MLQDTDSIPTEIAVSLSEKKIGFRLDNADLVRTNTISFFVFYPFFYASSYSFFFFFLTGACAFKEV